MRLKTVLLLSAMLLPTAAQAQGVPAGLTPAGDGMVQVVLSGDTVELADGRVVRLVSVTAPGEAGTADGGGGGAADPLAAAAGARLAELVQGRAVLLYLAGRAQDRHGRVLAHLVRAQDGLWVQGELLREGLVRMETWTDTRGAATALRRAEDQARKQEAGLWADQEYRPRPADRSQREWAGDLGEYHIIRGRVQSAMRVRDRVYLNFGRDWSTDFTVEIEQRDLRLFDGAYDPLRLEGRFVEVRGWLEDRNGPAIQVTHPEQIRPVEE